MKVWLNNRLSFFFISMFLVFFHGISPVLSANISLIGKLSENPNRKTFVLEIADAPNEIVSFGLDIAFDPNVLMYESITRGVLTANFDLFKANFTENKILKIAGVEAGEDIIPEGAGGAIAFLNFQVKAKEGNTELNISNLKDDITSWTKEDGIFSSITDGTTAANTEDVSSTNSDESESTTDKDDGGRGGKCFIKILH